MNTRTLILISAFSFQLSAFAADKIHIVVPASYTGDAAVSRQPLTLTATAPLPRVYSTNIFSRQPISRTTDTNGVTTFSNVLWGYYRLDIPGNPGTSFGLIVGTNLSGLVNVATLITNGASMPPNPSSNYLTEAQSGGRFLQAANIIAGDNVTVETSGLDVTINSTGGGGSTEAVAGSASIAVVTNGSVFTPYVTGTLTNPITGRFTGNGDGGGLTNLLPTTLGAFYTNQLSVTGGVFTAFSYPHLTIVTNTYSLSSNAVVAEISAPNLTAAGVVTIDLDASVANIDLRSLTYVNGEFYVGDMDSLTNINLSSLVNTGDDFFIKDNIALTTVSLPAFVSAFGDLFAIQSDGGVGVPAVTNFSAPRWILRDQQTVFFINTALTAASVNHILARGVASGVTNCILDTSQGGMNAAPTGQGITDKATLISRGNSVTTD